MLAAGVLDQLCTYWLYSVYMVSVGEGLDHGQWCLINMGV